MLKLKLKIMFIIALLIITVSGCKAANVEINADYPHYDDLDSMILHADTIIEGKILAITVENLNINSNPEEVEELLYTIYDVEVIKVFRGETKKKEIIQIKQLGGETENLIVTTEDKSNIKKDLSYLFFLATYKDSPASLINPKQGAYLIKDGKYIEDNDNKIKINKELLEQKLKNLNN